MHSGFKCKKKNKNYKILPYSAVFFFLYSNILKNIACGACKSASFSVEIVCLLKSHRGQRWLKTALVADGIEFVMKPNMDQLQPSCTQALCQPSSTATSNHICDPFSHLWGYHASAKPAQTMLILKPLIPSQNPAAVFGCSSAAFGGFNSIFTKPYAFKGTPTAVNSVL